MLQSQKISCMEKDQMHQGRAETGNQEEEGKKEKDMWKIYRR